MLIMKETLWRNKRNFVEDVPIIYIYLIINVITVSEKKVGSITWGVQVVRYPNFFLGNGSR